MKKLLALLLVFSMVFCFAACGKSDTIVVGYTIYEPMNYKDANGELVGFETEFAKAVCEILAVKPVFQKIDWNSKETELAAKSIDCIWNGMTIDAERAANMSITIPYMENQQVMIVKK